MAITFGSESIFSSNNIQECSVDILDSTHFVVAYQDRGNSNYGTAIIGTIAGDGSITYGSSVVFASAYSYDIHVKKLDSTRFVVVSNSSGGRSFIGTVANGNEISFGHNHCLQYYCIVDILNEYEA